MQILKKNCILNSMYTNLRSHVLSNGQLVSEFNITIGSRQGCHLSPNLFNLFINDIPSILSKANCDPVYLNTHTINTNNTNIYICLQSTSNRAVLRTLHISPLSWTCTLIHFLSTPQGAYISGSRLTHCDNRTTCPTRPTKYSL